MSCAWHTPWMRSQRLPEPGTFYLWTCNLRRCSREDLDSLGRFVRQQPALVIDVRQARQRVRPRWRREHLGEVLGCPLLAVEGLRPCGDGLRSPVSGAFAVQRHLHRAGTDAGVLLGDCDGHLQRVEATLIELGFSVCGVLDLGKGERAAAWIASAA